MSNKYTELPASVQLSQGDESHINVRVFPGEPGSRAWQRFSTVLDKILAAKKENKALYTITITYLVTAIIKNLFDVFSKIEIISLYQSVLLLIQKMAL